MGGRLTLRNRKFLRSYEPIFKKAELTPTVPAPATPSPVSPSATKNPGPVDHAEHEEADQAVDEESNVINRHLLSDEPTTNSSRS